MSRRRFWLVFAAIVLVVLTYTLTAAPAGPRSIRSFDPDRTAALELDMWQAYYAKDKLRLFRGLVTLLHEQNRYSWGRSVQAAYHLARAASRFSEIRSDYEQVLPDLEHAYTIERDWLGAGFDPKAVARAELAWWVARRVPGQESPANVGALIAAENALLYDVPVEAVLSASVLRARAGRLRDEGGERADWPQVSALLHQSFRELHTAVQK
jgi:hypothetical protein